MAAIKVKRFLIHIFDRHALKWRVTDKELHLTKGAALYKLNLFESSDKFTGIINNYRIVCITV